MQHTTELIQLMPNTLHHCSSIVVAPEAGRVIAAYMGPECEDAQCVFIKGVDKPHLELILPPKTGNPLLWQEPEGLAAGVHYLLYSKFEDQDDKGNRPQYPVQRWMYCSTWFAKVRITEREIKIIDEQEVRGGFGLLARCAPYLVDGRYFIPMYREKDPRCEIWATTNGNLSCTNSFLERVSVFGEITEDEVKSYAYQPSKLGVGVAIQPTLLEINGLLVAICRNVCVNAEFAWMFQSTDRGKSWSKPMVTKIPNHNNSLTASPWDSDSTTVLFNPDRYRSEMLLGNRFNNFKLGVQIGKLQRHSYSYPNYCIDHLRNLHIVHSNSGVIAVHKMDSEFVEFVVFGNQSNERKKSKIK